MKAVRPFIMHVIRELQWRLAGAAALAVALACVEGAGLILLIPLLQSIGLTTADTRASGVADTVTAAFAAVNLKPTLPAILFIFTAVATAHAFLYRANTLLHPALEQRFGLALRRRLYAAVVHADWYFFTTRRPPEMLHAITVEADRVTGSVYHLLAVFTGLATSAVYFAVAVRLSPLLSTMVILMGLVVLWSVQHRTRRSGELGLDYSDADRALFHTASESIAGLKIAKVLGTERRAVETFSAQAAARATTYLALTRSFAQSKTNLDILSAVLISGLLYVAVQWLDVRGVGLLVLIFVFARVMPRVMSLQNAAQVMMAGLAPFNSVMQLIKDGEAHADRTAAPATPRTPLRREWRSERISFAYGSGSPLVLRDVSLTIPAGRITAIVGASGAGKSTLADILIGLLRPTTGSVAVDGHPFTEADTAAWRRSIGYVPQDGFLLHDTVRANLLWAKPDSTDDQLWEALECAAAADFLRARPQGLDAVVGDRGIRLSGGERQRLALARALLARPEMLVLDEATSALDSLNEQVILGALKQLEGGVTTVIITHRLAAIRDADVIHVLERGVLVESGTWAELLARGGVFATLFAAQGLDRLEVTSHGGRGRSV